MGANVETGIGTQLTGVNVENVTGMLARAEGKGVTVETTAAPELMGVNVEIGTAISPVLEVTGMNVLGIWICWDRVRTGSHF